VSARADDPVPKPGSPHEKDREIDRLRRENDRLQQKNARLERMIDRLKKELAAARRAGQRQAAPFSKGAPTRHPQPPGRRAGRRHGRHAHRQPPAQVDETLTVRLPTHCPECGGRVMQTRVATQIQEDLPVVRPSVRRFIVPVGRCRQCGRRVQGRHPLQTTDALGAASTHVGPQAVALMVLLNKRFGLSHGKTAMLLREWFHLTVQPSGVTHALHRVARHAAPTYAQLQAQVRGSPMVSPDETSWKVGGRSWWLWAFVTPQTVVYAIQPGRGFAQAAAVLGADFGGVLVRDGWQGYRPFVTAGHQTCLAHLLRRCRDVRDRYPRAPWPRRVRALLKTALGLRDRYTRGQVSPRTLATRHQRLIQQLQRLIAHAPRTGEIYHLAAHLRREAPAVFRFVTDPAVDATNWRAEQALRPAVVNRKVSGGNRTPHGAATQQILTSVVQSARLRGLSPQRVLVDLLRAPTLAPSPALS
jgi:transposase